jgi:hypothetical protein
MISPRKGWFAFIAIIGMALLLAAPAFSYLHELSGSSATPVRDHWNFSAGAVQWQVNTQTQSNIANTNQRSVEQVMQDSFQTWISAPNAALNITEGAKTVLATVGSDGINLVCFVCKPPNGFTDANTLAITITSTDNTGRIMDADISFNPAVNFTTTSGTCSLSSCNDLQTVATHEIGHFLGLDHSAVVRAMMFPFAPPVETTLSMDDVAAISLTYPKAAPDVPTGTISGTIRYAGAGAVFGAHVFANSTTGVNPFSSFTPAIRETPIGSMSRPDGTYQIEGLPADSYIVAAEPLDLPVENSDISDYASAFGQASVQTNFTTRWH